MKKIVNFHDLNENLFNLLSMSLVWQEISERIILVVYSINFSPICGDKKTLFLVLIVFKQVLSPFKFMQYFLNFEI